MKRKIQLFAFFVLSLNLFAQKKALDHSVYDSWQNITTRLISNDGKWTGYSVDAQEGDNVLTLQKTDNSKKMDFPRGAKVQFTSDSKFAIFSVKPFYKDSKAVKDKKMKKEKLAKDSLFIVNLQTLAVEKIPNVQSFKIPAKGGSIIAYLLENLKDKSAEPAKEDGDATPAEDSNAKPLKMVVRNLATNKSETYENVTKFSFNDFGQQLAYVTKKPEEKKKPDAKKDDSKEKTEEKVASNEEGEKSEKEESKEDKTKKEDKNAPKKYELQSVNWVNLDKNKVNKLVETEGDFSQLSFDEAGTQLAFVGTTSHKNDLIKDYSLYYYGQDGSKSKTYKKENPNMPKNWVISENSLPRFSKNGKQLYFGIAPKPVVKDTALIVNDHAIVDIWGYKDEDLQTIQLKNLRNDLKRSYLSVTNTQQANTVFIPLGNEKMESVRMVNEGNAPFVIGTETNKDSRLASQWTGSDLKDIYLVQTSNGQKTEVVKNLNGNVIPSPLGQYMVYFNRVDGNWYSYNVATKKTVKLNENTQISFVDEEFDMPDLPRAYGLAGFTDNDESVLIKDRYDIWEFFLNGKQKPRNLTQSYGRTNKISFDTYTFDPDVKSYSRKKPLLLSAFSEVTKENGIFQTGFNGTKDPEKIAMEAVWGYNGVIKAKNADEYILTKESSTQSANLYATSDFKNQIKLSATNPQQKNYNWLTAELVKWSTDKGHTSEGVLYKPENFDPNKKYPMLVYFYEKLSDNLNKYQAPAPTPSRLNISYFTSNGYLVFTPDISYIDGYPGESAMEYINSGVDYLAKNPWVDAKKIGIQGQSWGGYQVAYLITQTDRYAAAWAGAPVANMTSAYGGIRWGSGMNRQFQYEKSQSRIGKTLWEAQDLYLKNSPLFYLDKVNTPVAIMSNDNDGAVPWYQGIEMFTGLKRLGKPSWLLNYNREEHNLEKRQNRKDIQIRQQQFFDYYLKGAKAPVWMTTGVPATMKGIDWGFELTNEKP